MDENQQTAELIQKYVDGACSEAELAALEDVLTHHPQSAEALADALRMETGLTTIFRAEGRTADVLVQLSAAEPDGRLSLRERTSFRGAKGDNVPSRPVRFYRQRAWQLAAAVLIALGASWLLYQFAEPRVGQQLTGMEWNQVVSGDVLINGVQGQSVHDGSSLQVLGGSPAVVHLQDGSQAEFEPGATALIHGRVPGQRQWVELNEGSGTFRVEKAEGEFQVATQLGCVTTLGTEFSVGIEPASLPGELMLRSALLVVAALRGVVQVEFGGETYELNAGESRVFAQERDKPGPATAESGNAAPPATVRRTVTTPTPGTRRADAANTVRGLISFVDRTKVVLGGRRGSTEFALRADVRLTIDGKPAAIEQFNPGMVVSVERKNGQGPVIRMNGEGPTIGGSLKSIDDEKKTITISIASGDADREETYALARDASITRDGQGTKLSDLQPGTSLIVTLSVDKETVITITRRARPRRAT